MGDHDQNSEADHKILQQFMDLFIIPEITRRQEAGGLQKLVDLMAAQIIFFDDRKPQVRINSEVKAIFSSNRKPGVSWEPGDLVFENDIQSVEAVQLTDEDDPNCAHATFLRIGNSWWGAFDFRYNKELSIKHVEAAQQFVESAEFAFEHGYWSVFFDNLFSAAELSAKSILLLMPDPEFRKKTTHGRIKRKLNWFADLGNIQSAHQETFNKLFRLRDAARYLKEDISVPENECQQMLDSVKNLIRHAARRIGID